MIGARFEVVTPDLDRIRRVGQRLNRAAPIPENFSSSCGAAVCLVHRQTRSNRIHSHRMLPWVQHGV